MPKRVDPKRQRSEIRRAARRVFAQGGVRTTGLAQVARAAGMRRSSLYHYYADKAALVRDLTREILDEEEALFEAAAHGTGSSLERLERLAADATRLFDAWAAVGRVIFDLRMLESRRFRLFFRRIRTHVAAVVAEGQRRGEIDATLDPELAAAGLIGLIDGLLLQHFADPEVFADREALAAAVARAVRRGLGR
jgi:AcrR family transcriptional regulator